MAPKAPKSKAQHLAVALLGERPEKGVEGAWDPQAWTPMVNWATGIITEYLTVAEKLTIITRATPGFEMAVSIAAIKAARDADLPVQLRVVLPFAEKIAEAQLRGGFQGRGGRMVTDVAHYWDERVKAVFSTITRYASVEHAVARVEGSKAADLAFEQSAVLAAQAGDELVVSWSGTANILALAIATAACDGKAVTRVDAPEPVAVDAPKAKAPADAF